VDGLRVDGIKAERLLGSIFLYYLVNLLSTEIFLSLENDAIRVGSTSGIRRRRLHSLTIGKG
jgi:hypothetical protein